MPLENMRHTQHALARMRQRGMFEADMRVIVERGTQVATDAYLITNRDVDREIAVRKSEIKILERLRNKKVIVENGHVITCYYSSREDQKRSLMRKREIHV